MTSKMGATDGEPSRPEPALLSKLRALNHRIDLLIEWITSALLVTIVGTNAAEILWRTVLSGSLTWVYELNLLLANWLYFIGICLVYYRGKDVFVSFFFDRLPETGKRAALFAIHLASIVVLIVLALNAFWLLELQSRTTTMGLGISNHWFSMPVFIGATIMALYIITDLVELCLFPRADRNPT